MTDRLTSAPPHPPAPRADAVNLRAHGKYWGKLLDGRYLEVARRGQIVTFDLWESALVGHGVIVAVEDGDA